MPKKEKFKMLKLTITRHYLVPMLDNERTKINGWKMDDVIFDWFKSTDINISHATRDTYHIGNSDKIIDMTQLNPEDSEFQKED